MVKLPATPARPLDDLLLYRLSRLLSVAGSMVIKLCEGRFGITRREWRLIALSEPGYPSKNRRRGDEELPYLDIAVNLNGSDIPQTIGCHDCFRNSNEKNGSNNK